MCILWIRPELLLKQILPFDEGRHIQTSKQVLKNIISARQYLINRDIEKSFIKVFITCM
jgi:hypothetical protein